MPPTSCRAMRRKAVVWNQSEIPTNFIEAPMTIKARRRQPSEPDSHFVEDDSGEDQEKLKKTLRKYSRVAA